jgi:REP element-mobilizing transposase RayT
MAEKSNSDIPWRKNIRLLNFEYSSRGGYFITICSHQKRCIFGNIQNGVVQLSAIGEVVNNNWHKIPKHTAQVEIGTFVVMPNHIHGILYIMDEEFGIEPTSIPRT